MVFKVLWLGFAWFTLVLLVLAHIFGQPSQPSPARPEAGWLVGWLVNWLVGWLAGWLAGRSLAQQAPRAFPLTFNKDLIKKRKGIGPGSSRDVSIDF